MLTLAKYKDAIVPRTRTTSPRTHDLLAQDTQQTRRWSGRSLGGNPDTNTSL